MSIYTVQRKPGSSKAISIDQFPPEAWTVLLGKDVEEGAVRELYEVVPWLNRGVALRAAALSRLPFSITNTAGDVIDSSDNYKNAVGFLPGFQRMLAIAEMSLTLYGAHYILKDDNMLGQPLMLRNAKTSTITPQINRAEGLTGFWRQVGGDKIPLEIDQILYFWAPDPDVEIGPPEWSPAMAALAASGVLRNVDRFATAFFDRGAIKTTLLTIKGNPIEAERKRLKSWWRRLSQGINSAFSEGVVNAEGVEPVTIGEGLESLANTDLTKEKREDVSTGLGVPQSILFSNASNFAVSKSDKRNFYDETIIPQSRLIADVFNEQLFEPLGLQLAFEPNALDIYQEEEEDRSGALVNLANTMNTVPADITIVSMQIMGFDPPPGLEWDELRAMLDQVRVPAIPESQPTQPEQLSPVGGTVPDESEEGEEARALAQIDRDWQRYRKKVSRHG